MSTANTFTSLKPILKESYATCKKCGKKYTKKPKKG